MKNHPSQQAQPIRPTPKPLQELLLEWANLAYYYNHIAGRPKK